MLERKVGRHGGHGGYASGNLSGVIFIPFFFKLLIDRRLRSKPEEFIAKVEAQKKTI